MSDLDPELLERVIRWCAEAGRQTGAAEIRAALAPLSWDELLHVRALLADPPPARPLGPAALADLVRGTPADVAAEREREGRYRPELEPVSEPAGDLSPETKPAARASRARARRGGPRRPAGPVVHRKRDRPPPAAAAPPTAPAFERLLDPEGRAVLDRLIRDHGARRSFLLSELARWRRADGAAPDDADLTALLEHHGLARAFAHRERDELLHSLRAARGDRAAAARMVGLAPEAYQDALVRLRAVPDAERIRDDRRADLRARATLSERCRLLSTEADRLGDLGLLEEFESDLRARLGEHLRALRAGAAGPLPSALARSLSLEERDAVALSRRLGIDLGPTAPGVRRAEGAARGPGRPRTRPRGATTSRSSTGPKDARGKAPRRGQQAGAHKGAPARRPRGSRPPR